MPSKKLLLPVIGLISLLLTGCVSTTGSGGTKTVCLATKPITWSKQDTDQTIKEVKAHNAAWKAVCK